MILSDHAVWSMVGAVMVRYFIVIGSMISEMVWLNIEKNVRLERFNILAPPVIDSDPEVHGSVVTVSMITPFIFRGATFTVRTVSIVVMIMIDHLLYHVFGACCELCFGSTNLFAYMFGHTLNIASSGAWLACLRIAELSEEFF